MNELDIQELEYSNYLAEQEMLDKLAILSIKSHGVLTESALEAINESAMDTVLEYIKKITANIQVTWNKFKGVITKGEYALLKKQYGQYFNANTKIIAENNPEVCILKEVDNQLEITMPQLSEDILDDLSGTPEEFVQKQLKAVYEPDKSIKDVMNSKVFKTQNTLVITSESLKLYTGFLDNYQNKVNKAAEDIKNINNTSNIAKQIIEKMTIKNAEQKQETGNNNNQQNNTQQQNTTNQTQNNTQEEGTKESFNNLADTLLYYFTEEKASFRNVNDTPKDNNGNNTKQKKPDISKQVITYYKVSTQLLSAKLNILNKSRINALNIIKSFVTSAKKESGGKKENNTNSSNNAQNNNNDNIEITI